jgi:hypothetical protein
MPLSDTGGKLVFTGSEPVDPLDVKVFILRKGDSIARLAQRWHTTSAVLSRIIHRRGEYVYERERKLLARYLGIDIDRVGRLPNLESPKSRYARAKAA